MARNSILVGILFSFIVAAISVKPPQSMRLIEFNETTRKWMTEQEVLDLEPKSENFMDITNNPQPSPKKFVVDPIPTKITYQKVVNALIPDLEAGEITKTIEKLSSYHTRYYNSDTGKDAAHHLHSKFLEFSQGRDDITVEFFQHSWKQPSVIARIQGNDDDKAGTRVILGAHEDSIGTSSTAKAPGADDDASGSSTVLEVFRVLAQSGYKPNRTVEFHCYSAEEGGLKGSQAIAQAYYDLDIIVESMMQLDMDMYGQPSDPVGIITDFVNPDVSQFIRLLFDTYSSLDWVNSKCGYGCSDHASWTKYGYRSGFPFETSFGDHDPYIHTSQDTLDKISVSRGIEFGKVAIGYIVEMAS